MKKIRESILSEISDDSVSDDCISAENHHPQNILMDNCIGDYFCVI